MGKKRCEPEYCRKLVTDKNGRQVNRWHKADTSGASAAASAPTAPAASNRAASKSTPAKKATVSKSIDAKYTAPSVSASPRKSGSSIKPKSKAKLPLSFNEADRLRQILPDIRVEFSDEVSKNDIDLISAWLIALHNGLKMHPYLRGLLDRVEFLSEFTLPTFEDRPAMTDYDIDIVPKPYIQVNLSLDNRKQYAVDSPDGVHSDEDTGFLDYIAIHEMAHVANIASGNLLAKSYMEFMRWKLGYSKDTPDREVLKKAREIGEISPYASKNAVEAIAEAFAASSTSRKSTKFEQYGYNLVVDYCLGGTKNVME